MYYSEEYKIGNVDVDINNNIKPTDLVKCLNETANRQMNDRKPSYYDLFAENKSFIITRMSIEIYGQVHQLDDITVRTWTAGERGATFFRGYQVMRGDEELVRASADWAVVDVVDGHIYKTSEIDLSNYEAGEKPELSIKNRFIIPKDLVLDKLGVHHVDYGECDMNMHMNNTQYHNMLWNRIDGIIGKELTSINIKFRTEARYDSDIEIYGAKLENKELSGDSRAEEVYVFHTETEGSTNVEALIGVRKLRDEVPAYLRKYRDEA